MNRKGTIFDMVFWFGIIIFVAFMAILAGTLAYKFTGLIGDSKVLDNAPAAKENNSFIFAWIPHLSDEIILLFFLGGNIALIVAATRTNFSTTIIFLFIILLIFAIGLASMGTNLYQGFASDSSISDMHNNLTFTNILISKYTPLIISILGGVILIIMYGKSGGDVPV